MACQLQGLSDRMNIHFQTSQIDNNCPVQQIPAADHPYTVSLNRQQEISVCVCVRVHICICACMSHDVLNSIFMKINN
jgi:hypothetical protein